MTAREFIGYYDYLTPALKDLVFHYESAVTQEAFTQFLTDIEVLLVENYQHLERATPGAERAQKYHQLMDSEIQKADSIPTSCHKGCAACCHYEVTVSADEAALLVDLIEGGQVVKSDRLEMQAKRKPQDPSWLLGVVESNACIFLNEEAACSIYENRPASCRKHSVVSPAEHCLTRKAVPVVRNVPLAEIVMSSATGVAEGRVGSLAAMVMAEIRQRRLAQAGHLTIADK